MVTTIRAIYCSTYRRVQCNWNRTSSALDTIRYPNSSESSVIRSGGLASCEAKLDSLYQMPKSRLVPGCVHLKRQILSTCRQFAKDRRQTQSSAIGPFVSMSPVQREITLLFVTAWLSAGRSVTC